MSRLCQWFFPEWTAAKKKFARSNLRVLASSRITGRTAPLLFGLIHVVLLELAVQGCLPDAQHAGCGKLIAVSFAKGAKNGAALQLLQRKDLLFLRDCR